MKFAIVCTVLALACAVNTLSVGGYGFKGPIVGSAPSKPQPQVELEAPVEENYLTPVDPKSETEVKDENVVTFEDLEFAYKPIIEKPEAVQQTLAEEEEVVENDTTHVELKSEIEKEDFDLITLLDPEFVQQPTDTEPLAELGKPDILVKPSFLDKSPNPSILDPY